MSAKKRPNTADHKHTKKQRPFRVFMKGFWAALRVACKTAFAVILLAACIAGGLLIGVVAGCIITTPPLEDEDLYISGFTSFIYDNAGEVIGQLKGSENINRIWVEIEEVPRNLQHAFVAIEDERFYTHPGVDVKRTISAFLGYFLPGMSSHGGSTITQQVIKNVTGDDAQSVPRKIREQWRAYQLEKNYNKNEILEFYVNVIYMGQDLYGVKTAAQAYFEKDLSELSLAECAFLAGITNNPGRYNPLTTTGRSNCYKRQIIILDKMLELGYISEAEYIEAIQTELKINDDYKKDASLASKHSYFVEAVISDVREAFMEAGYTKTQANNLIYNTGITIITTQDSAIQQIVNEEFTNLSNFPANHLYTDPKDMAQASIVIMDHHNGQVLALYGGYGEKDKNLTFNRAISAQRQPGSSIKPILVYAPLIDQKIITAGTVIDDAPSYLDPQKPDEIWPTNADNAFHGLTTVRRALADSYNVVAVKLYQDHQELGLSYLKKLGIDRMEETQLALALGGMTNGVSTMQMAAAYVPFANSGIYYEPILFTKVYDKDGKLLLDNTSDTTLVYEDHRTPSVMTSLLEEVVKSGTGTSTQVYNGNQEKIATAGKTGTTSSTYDYWYVGYTPYYTAAVWYGYDKQTSISYAERGAATRLWGVIMNRIHKDLAAKSFAYGSDLISCDVCTKSGKYPTSACYSANSVKKEVFMSGTQPTPHDSCTYHK